MQQQCETKFVNRWQKARNARKRWSFNAYRKRERIRMERVNSPLEELTRVKPYKPKRIPFDLKLNLERRDGGRIQFRLHFFNGKLIGQNIRLTPKQFGRKLGEIFEVWMQP